MIRTFFLGVLLVAGAGGMGMGTAALARAATDAGPGKAKTRSKGKRKAGAMAPSDGDSVQGKSHGKSKAGAMAASDDPGTQGNGDQTLDAKAAFASTCQACHGAQGRGDPPVGKMMGVKDWRDPSILAKKSDDEVRKTIREGIVQDGKRRMPSYSHLPPETIEALARYVRTFQK